MYRIVAGSDISSTFLYTLAFMYMLLHHINNHQGHAINKPKGEVIINVIFLKLEWYK